jgi:hypothetical protein
MMIGKENLIFFLKKKISRALFQTFEVETATLRE